MSFAEKLLAGKLNEEKKKLIEFIKPEDESIKHKLEGIRIWWRKKPRLIIIELIKDAIAEYKQEKGNF